MPELPKIRWGACHIIYFGQILLASEAATHVQRKAWSRPAWIRQNRSRPQTCLKNEHHVPDLPGFGQNRSIKRQTCLDSGKTGVFGT